MKVRAVSRELGLPNWNHAASPCLRSRLAFGVQATPERLQLVEQVNRKRHHLWTDINTYVGEGYSLLGLSKSEKKSDSGELAHNLGSHGLFGRWRKGIDERLNRGMGVLDLWFTNKQTIDVSEEYGLGAKARFWMDDRAIGRDTVRAHN